MKTRTLGICIALTMLLFAGCGKSGEEHKFMAEGYITGFDLRGCGCCGGLMINLDGNTQPYAGNYYLIINEASELGITSSTTFPVKIKVDYQLQGVSCLANQRIQITIFAKQ